MCDLPESADSAVRLGTLMTSFVAHRVGGGGDDGAAVDRLQSGHAETRPSVTTLVCAVQRYSYSNILYLFAKKYYYEYTFYSQ